MSDESGLKDVGRVLLKGFTAAGILVFLFQFGTSILANLTSNVISETETMQNIYQRVRFKDTTNLYEQDTYKSTSVNSICLDLENVQSIDVGIYSRDGLLLREETRHLLYAAKNIGLTSTIISIQTLSEKDLFNREKFIYDNTKHQFSLIGFLKRKVSNISRNNDFSYKEVANELYSSEVVLDFYLYNNLKSELVDECSLSDYGMDLTEELSILNAQEKIINNLFK